MAFIEWAASQLTSDGRKHEVIGELLLHGIVFLIYIVIWCALLLLEKWFNLSDHSKSPEAFVFMIMKVVFDGVLLARVVDIGFYTFSEVATNTVEKFTVSKKKIEGFIK